MEKYTQIVIGTESALEVQRKENDIFSGNDKKGSLKEILEC